MIPTCFNSTHSSTTQLPQSLITSIYQTQLSLCNSISSINLITLTWTKTLSSHTLTIHATDLFTITISLHPSTFSLFKTRPGSGSKSITLTHQKLKQNSQTFELSSNRTRGRYKLYYDFTKAKFPPNSAEPSSAFYVAIACNAEFQFFLGDLQHELTKRSGLAITSGQLKDQTMLLSRREHVFSRKNVYVSRMHVMGIMHEVEIECIEEKELRVKVDGETRLVVKRLAWKFRGNERICVDGIEVDFFWDVFNWVNNGNCGHGVFVFQVGEGSVWPAEMVGPEKRLMKMSLSFGGSMCMSAVSFWPSPSCSSVLQWAEETSDCGRSSCSSSTRSCGSNGGFSLMVYAWRKE